MYCIRQLWVFSFCIYSAKTGKSFFYLYDETSGGKSPNEVLSCIHDFLQNRITPRVKTLYLFCDNCGAQNRNIVLVQFCNALKENRKRERFYAPSDYSQLIYSASCKFQVNVMNSTNLLDYKSSLAQSFKNRAVSDTRRHFTISKYRVFIHSSKFVGKVQCAAVSSGIYTETFPFLK
ncbi:hypothetical protein PR048_011269 [Dryococelus australis]|uniref:Uncharacterized protein n=1 Tax=Dryococelus australis TaxID=614101 RepID=A0ABQ9HL32_9NEOP|nr:hypothetical protein PR048_011269 [Dryococelus australis]